MRTEIGSDFALDMGDFLAHPQAWGVFGQFSTGSRLCTDSGRTALRLGLRELGMRPGHRLLTPAYMCGTVLQALREEGIMPVFYGVDQAFNLEIREPACDAVDAVLVPDYFGVRSRYYEELSRRLVSDGRVVIRDISHSLLAPLQRSHQERCVYIASLRKTLPIPDGGLMLGEGNLSAFFGSLVESDSPHATVRAAAMLVKAIYSACPGSERPPFRDRFLEAERLLDGSRVLGRISAVSDSLLPFLNVGFFASARRRNFIDLLEMSTDWPPEVVPVCSVLEVEDVPLGFPVLCSQRDSLRTFLMDRRIYPPIHWPIPDEVSAEYPLSRHISRRILTIPCDHRYNADDMRSISSAIIEWGNSIWKA